MSDNVLARFQNKFEHISSLFDELKELADSLPSDRFSIVALGIYNQGKSTLLNQLISDFHNSTFKVSDIRQTREDQVFCHDNYLFVDTPGLNADAYDDAVAVHAQQRANMYLFVHKITTGELNSQEIGFLEQFANKQGLASFFDSTIFVLTNIANCSDEQTNSVVIKVKEQLRSHFGTAYNYKIIAVDSLRYAQGNLEHKELFIKKSFIAELKTLIEQTKKQLQPQLQSIKAEKIAKKLQPLKEELYSFRDQISKEKAKQEHLLETVNKKFQAKLEQYQEQEELTYNVDSLLDDIAFLTDLQNNDYDEIEYEHQRSHCYDICDRIDRNEQVLEQLRQSMMAEFDFDPSVDFECPKIEMLNETIDSCEHMLSNCEQLLSIVSHLEANS